MFRCVLSVARDVPLSSYSRKVAWLQHVRRGVNADCLRSPTCDISFRFSLLSRLCENNVRYVSSHEWNSQTLPSHHRVSHRAYSSGGENDGEKRRAEEGKGQEIDSASEDGLDDEFRDILKEISRDFESGDSGGEEERKTPSDSNMNAATHPSVSLDTGHDASTPAVQEPQLPQSPSLMATEIEDFTQYDEDEMEDEVEPERVLPVDLIRKSCV